MRTRIADMRALLARHLAEATGGGSFDFLRTQRGMFSLLGVSVEAVERLRDRHHIYMTPDSRMNLAGIMPHNANYVAESIAAELLAETQAPRAWLLAAESLVEGGDLGGRIAHHGLGPRLVEAEAFGGGRVAQGGFEAGDVRRV